MNGAIFMKKLLIFLLVFFLFSFTFFAQSESDKQPDWKIFSPSPEEFSVEIPGELFFEDYDRRTKSRRYRNWIGGNYYYIFSDTLKNDEQYKTILKFVEIYKPLELISQKKSDSMNFIFSDEEKFYHTISIQKTKDRIYTFHLVSEKENDPAVRRFFQSLKINARQVATLIGRDAEPKNSENNIREPVIVNRQDNNPEQLKEISEKSNSTSADGTGTGQGSEFGNENPSVSANSERQVIQTKPLKITFRPKPKYTDFARFYEITGSVRIRVTFLNNGTIGSASPFTKLPFGLTDSAIFAAKRLRFEPMIANGKKLSVTKTVVFTFTIY